MGADVEQWQLGDEVFGSLGHGCLPKKPGACGHPCAKPASMSCASAGMVQPDTSYSQTAGQLQPGETYWCLAPGGIGLAAVELGKASARVIAAASGDES